MSDIGKQFENIVAGNTGLPSEQDAQELNDKMDRAHTRMHESSKKYAHAVKKIMDFHNAGLKTDFWPRQASYAAQDIDGAHEFLGNEMIMRMQVPGQPDHHYCKRCGEPWEFMNIDQTPGPQ